MICKIQRALFPPGEPCLVYNKSRSVNRFMPLREMERHFRSGELKFYAEIEWTNAGTIKSLRRLPAEKW